MKAVFQDRYGLADVLELRDVDRPRPGADEVCIEVRAASLNMYDWHMIRCWLASRPVSGFRSTPFPAPMSPAR